MPLPKETPVGTATLNFQPVQKSGGERVCLYGPTKIGKTSLALKAPTPIVFFDLDDSLGKLETNESILTLPVSKFSDLETALNSPIWDDIRTIVIDSATVLEQMAIEDVLEKVKTKNGKANSIEDYGFGKGYRLLFDRLDRIIQSAENHRRAGRNVILICHAHTGYKPNAAGEDFLCYSPDLLETKQFSFKERVKAWADHILFINYDVNVEDRKGQGTGSRGIHTKELPYMTAGSRTVKKGYIPYDEGSDEIWQLIFKKEGK